MSDQFREEHVKIAVKSGFLLFKNRQGTREVERPSQPAADSLQNATDSGDASVRCKPILLPHASEDRGSVLGNFRQANFKIAIKVIDELPKRDGGVFRPVAGQKMIEVDVGQDAAEAAVGRRKPQHA